MTVWVRSSDGLFCLSALNINQMKVFLKSWYIYPSSYHYDIDFITDRVSGQVRVGQGLVCCCMIHKKNLSLFD